LWQLPSEGCDAAPQGVKVGGKNRENAAPARREVDESYEEEEEEEEENLITVSVTVGGGPGQLERTIAATVLPAVAHQGAHASSNRYSRVLSAVLACVESD
jgi:hypothetical protein